MLLTNTLLTVLVIEWFGVLFLVAACAMRIGKEVSSVRNEIMHLTQMLLNQRNRP